MSSGRVSQHVQRSAATDCPSESTLGRDQNGPGGLRRIDGEINLENSHCTYRSRVRGRVRHLLSCSVERLQQWHR